MRISRIKIKKFAAVKGHIGFVSCVIDDWLYLGNIAIFLRLNSNNIRLVFPEKKIDNKIISMFYPLTKEAYGEFEKVVFENFKQL